MEDIRAGVPCATTGEVGEKDDLVLGAPMIAAGIVVAVVGVALPDIEDVGDDMWATEPDLAACAAALCFFSRATCRSSCKKFNPDDCRLDGSFGFCCTEGEETDTKADPLASARASNGKTFCGV
jgi:hypothetical protein